MGRESLTLILTLILTLTLIGRSSLWVESEPGKCDLHQLVLKCGEMTRFYGVLCHHKAIHNLT